ncbi:MAG: DUF1566 domain-containing protein [Nitrospiraceae bacterium]
MNRFTRLAIGCGMLMMGAGASVGLDAGSAVGPNEAKAQGLPDLSGVTQNWDKNLPAGERFVVLGGAFHEAAVLDKNTGLVWEKSPLGEAEGWGRARVACLHKHIGGIGGWRLPAIAELASLLAFFVAGEPKLPDGHPFLNVLFLENYWSASSSGTSPNSAWVVNFEDGQMAQFNNDVRLRYWCVRGGMQQSVY